MGADELANGCGPVMKTLVDEVCLSFCCCCVRLRKRYHGLYDRVFVSQFDIACISESAAQQAAAEAKAGATAATASDQPTDGANPPAPAAPKSAATPDAPADPFPLNKLLKPNAVITVETVK